MEKLDVLSSIHSRQGHQEQDRFFNHQISIRVHDAYIKEEIVDETETTVLSISYSAGAKTVACRLFLAG